VNVVISQALASGLPVISTRHSGIPDQVKDGYNGFLVGENNYKELAEKIIYMIEHPEIWPKFGENGKKHILKNYSSSDLMGKQVDIYNEIINSK